MIVHLLRDMSMARTRACQQISAMASPGVGEAGRTGDWRTSRPVIDQSKCLHVKRSQASCFLCWLYCPEAVIKRKFPVEIDLTYCKGCGVCSVECPTGAITMVAESSAAGTEGTP